MEKLIRDNVLVEKSVKFAVRILKAHEYLNKNKKMYTISKQILRSGTSVGANIVESTGAISKNDYSAKISIAYKECLETKYWLYILKSELYIDEKVYSSIYTDADELAKMLYSTLKSTRIKPKENK